MKRIITYDLAYADSKDYEDLYFVLNKLNGKKITESTYVINTPLGQKEISDMIREVIYKDDKVFFISVNSNGELFYTRIE